MEATQLAAMPMSTSAMPMAKYFAAVKKKPIITANVFTAVPPSHTAKKPAMKNPRIPSFVSLSPPGSFSVDTLNTLSAMRLVSPFARAMSDRPRGDEAGDDAWDAHASAAACSAPAETPGTRRGPPGVARADARARIATRAEGAERPVVLGFVLREMPRARDARDPARGLVEALIAFPLVRERSSRCPRATAGSTTSRASVSRGMAARQRGATLRHDSVRPYPCRVPRGAGR